MSRLIDADALLKDIKGRKTRSYPKGELEWTIEQQPTIEAVPVVHGYDLVSRKMVVQYLQEQQANVIIEKAKKGFVSDDVCDGMKSAVDAFMNFIVQAPSEEAVPVDRNRIIDEFARKAVERLEELNCEAWRKDILAIAEEMKGGAE